MTSLVLDMRQTSSAVLIEKLVDITVGMVKMLEQFAKVNNFVRLCIGGFRIQLDS